MLFFLSFVIGIWLNLYVLEGVTSWSWGRQRERDEACLRDAPISGILDSDMVATWDAYGPPGSEMALVPEKGNAIAVAEQGSVGADGAMCLLTGKEQADPQIQMAVAESRADPEIQRAVAENQKRYEETGYKELERLTHETYAQGP